jgi:hypothetical protein
MGLKKVAILNLMRYKCKAKDAWVGDTSVNFFLNSCECRIACQIKVHIDHFTVGFLSKTTRVAKKLLVLHPANKVCKLHSFIND